MIMHAVIAGFIEPGLPREGRDAEAEAAPAEVEAAEAAEAAAEEEPVPADAEIDTAGGAWTSVWQVLNLVSPRISQCFVAALSATEDSVIEEAGEAGEEGEEGEAAAEEAPAPADVFKLATAPTSE
ncbi:hypothetical protein EMIHUDRAFT_357082 [Emiliania huxleyi CCMP1516]|uniref:Uncharacterized protein n=2 Tax=Emiliania huxleyi TaxID=2903 RepID=A0A0D3IPG0_EMIH1|nr:hypothetical protein EMIHUDRAFT_357082 [Emiliania huxleyi CCMP1516]EOD13145.1 hypothetical protein EMIHUDRAFT_357082 [Emiliania huxleyi CCMP1516]|eukprot:XP_005765574.1 hypothetical protein EMIHUDRAFT_357082 [Emiliania huxleyi CCMP1516]